MTLDTVSLEEARALALAAQGLASALPGVAPTVEGEHRTFVRRNLVVPGVATPSMSADHASSAARKPRGAKCLANHGNAAAPNEHGAG